MMYGQTTFFLPLLTQQLDTTFSFQNTAQVVNKPGSFLLRKDLQILKDQIPALVSTS